MTDYSIVNIFSVFFKTIVLMIFLHINKIIEKLIFYRKYAIVFCASIPSL